MTRSSSPFRLQELLSSKLLIGWPNRLTLSRVAAIPLILLIYPLNFTFTNYLCTAIFCFAALTDYLDGYLARKYNQVTTFGALLDPIADKMLTAAALVLLSHAKQLPPIVAGLLLCRDALISGVRLIGQEQNIKIEVSQIGKFKTAILDFGMAFLFLREEEFMSLPAHTIGMLCVWLGLVLSLYSAFLYLQSFLQKAKMSA